MTLVAITKRLRKDVDALTFSPPVTHVYDPLDYAWAPHAKYLERFGTGPKEAVFLGMNPGPYGMAQTGVPFGEVSLVRDFLGVSAAVTRPKDEHPKRPIEGFACTRSEVSGARFWGWAKQRFVTPEAFFSRFFVVNYCPLVFMEESGKNRTPDKLLPKERDALYAPCDRALRAMVETLSAKQVIGIGAFAKDRASIALEGMDVSLGSILHPSPASPIANRGWAPLAEAQLRALGVAVPT